MTDKVKTNIKKIIKVILLVIVIVLFAVFLAVKITNKKQNKPTFIFGHAVLWVETGSMEPTIPTRSYISVKASDGNNLSEGTVITFICQDTSSQVYGQLVTHRIVGITDDGNGYYTQGDNNSVKDSWVVNKSDVVATYEKNLSVATVFGRIFASPVGLILIAGVFLGSCAFLYIPDIVNSLHDNEDDDLAKQHEIERRIEEEVKKLQEKDGNNQ